MVKDKSLDLIHEKQELDIYLSSIKAIQGADIVVREKGLNSEETGERSSVVDQGNSLNLIREKEETEIFLSSITILRPPDGIKQEKAVVAAETDKELSMSDHLSAYKEPEIKVLSDEEPRPDKIDRGKIVIASRSKEDTQISVALLKEEASKNCLSDMEDRSKDQPQAGDKNIKDEAVVLKELPGVVQTKEVAVQMSNTADIPQPEKIGNAEQTIVLKSQQKTEIAPEIPSVKKDEKPKKLTPEPSKKKSKQVSWWGTSMRFFALFLVFIVVIEGYLWMYPDVGYQTIAWMHSNVPMMDKLLGIEKVQQDIITDQVEFINVKQRLVKNESLGNLRVIEGDVANRADFPIAKIKIMGEIFDSSGALLAARIAYCGNVLPDETLGRLKEEEIRSALSVSSGGSLSSYKILPKGQLPFMIVFTREPAGVAKATVTAVGAERISP